MTSVIRKNMKLGKTVAICISKMVAKCISEMGMGPKSAPRVGKKYVCYLR